MMTFERKFPPLSTPRTGSLRDRLLRAPGAKDASPGFLDQLMIFLEDPPPKVRDRWKAGADMCAAWGVPTTGPSIWRLYRSYALEWRLGIAREAGPADGVSVELLQDKAEQLIALRTFELLSNPSSPPAFVATLARIACRKKALELERLRYSDTRMATLLTVAKHSQPGRNPPVSPSAK